MTTPENSYATVDALLRPRAVTETEDIDVPGVGTITVRALTRIEALSVTDKPMPMERVEQILLATAMVRPVMTEDQVRQWQEASAAGEIQEIANKITVMSGMSITADRAAMSQFRR